MKFEFDHKTGTMIPKKDEQIYFAKSMGGGLRIDDNKNHRKYIIERDGGLSILQGPRLHAEQFLHAYDQRDARIIADRVVRMFGKSHFYADYRKFLKGVSESTIIKKFDQFVDENFSKLYGRWSKGDVRNEDKYNPDFIDFGDDVTVLWSAVNFGETSNWDDIKDFNKDGWRLPTVKEVKQLDWKNVRISWMDGFKRVRFDKGGILKINDPEGNMYGGFHMWTSDESKKFNTSAYSYGFDNLYKFDIDTLGKYNMLYVFLVKDKSVNV